MAVGFSAARQWRASSWVPVCACSSESGIAQHPLVVLVTEYFDHQDHAQRAIAADRVQRTPRARQVQFVQVSDFADARLPSSHGGLRHASHRDEGSSLRVLRQILSLAPQRFLYVFGSGPKLPFGVGRLNTDLDRRRSQASWRSDTPLLAAAQKRASRVCVQRTPLLPTVTKPSRARKSPLARRAECRTRFASMRRPISARLRGGSCLAASRIWPTSTRVANVGPFPLTDSGSSRSIALICSITYLCTSFESSDARYDPGEERGHPRHHAVRGRLEGSIRTASSLVRGGISSVVGVPGTADHRGRRNQ